MKHHLYFFLVCSFCLILCDNLAAQDPERTYVITDFNVPDYNARVSGGIPLGTGTSTWTSDNAYILDGQVFVNPGDKLTIDAGTLIKGRHNRGDQSQTSALIVSKGADIEAIGSISRPIIFTSEGDNLNRTGNSDCPNAEVDFLSDLRSLVTLEEQAPGQGPIEWDTANGEGNERGGPTIQMNGKSYEKGIGMHSSFRERNPEDPEVTRVVFDLSRQSYDWFKADVGLQDDKLINVNTQEVSAISVEFVVVVDGIVQYESGLVVAGDRIQYVQVDVSGASTLELILENGGDYGTDFPTVAGNRKNSDHGNWGNARLERCISSGADRPQENQDPIALDKGLWGGIMILGNAGVNISNTLVELEGDTFGRADYGGSNDNDNSGTLRYVSIRHAGAEFSGSRKYNGLTLAGVGRQTTIDFLDVHACLADALKFAGGTVNTKHISVSFCDGDAFDTDEGYRGNGQFWFALLENGSQEGGGEHDNSSSSLAAQPFSNAIIYNASFFGADNTTGETPAVDFRKNAAGSYINSLFTDFRRGIEVEWNQEGTTSYDQFATGNLTLQNNIFWNIANASAGTGEELFLLDPVSGSPGAAEADFARGFSEGSNIYNSPEFEALNSRSRTPGERAFDPRPRLDGLGFAKDDPAAYPGGFFETVDYKGAFGSDLWIGTWTGLDDYGFLGTNGMNPNGNPRLPDLLFSSTNQASLPGEIPTSGSITFTFTIRNAGDFPSEKNRVRVREGTRELDTEDISFLEVGGSSTFNMTISGTELGLGSHTLTVEIDPDQDIREGNESNNSFSHTVQVVSDAPTFPDVELSNLESSASSPIAGNPLLLTFDIENIGEANSGEITVGVNLGGVSLSPQPPTLPALEVGDKRSVSVEVTIPEGTTLGSQTLTLTLQEANDSDLTNNSGTLDLEISERPAVGPDLTIISFSVDSTEICPGNTLSMTIEVENQGDENAGTFFIGVTFRENSLTSDPSSITNGLTAGSKETFTTSLTLPSNESIGAETLTLTLFLNEDIDPSNNSSSTTVTIKNCPVAPPCTFTVTRDFPTTHTMGQGGTSQPNIRVSDVSQVEQVNFLYRPISSFDGTFTVQPLSPDGDVYSASLGDTDFGPIGISYTFQILASGCENKSESGHMYLAYPDPGLTLTPSITAGSVETDYKMISVPLDLDSRGFQSTFGDELQDDEDKTRWRFMRFNGSSTADHTGNIDPGFGYWILATFPTSLQSGAGTTVQVTEDSPFSINLTSNGAFTQIGNPYNFRVSWEDVLAENEASRSLLKLLTYNRGWDSLEVLSPFQGAFVQNNAGLSRIQIPVKRNPNVNRLGNFVSLPSLDAPAWKVGIKLETQELIHNVSAFGMHPRASTGIDEQDMKGLPRFSTFLDLNFPMEDHPNKAFRENYVATQDTYTWDMEIASSGGEPIKVSWENEYFGSNEKELWLENLQTGQVVDMRNQETLHIRPNSQRSLFRIHFGPLDYVQSQVQELTPWIDAPYPNPFQQEVFLSLFFPGEFAGAELQAELFNLMGKKVAHKSWKIRKDNSPKELRWDLSPFQLTQGMYLYRIRIVSEEGTFERIEKLQHY